jgi:hypothetical protein
MIHQPRYVGAHRKRNIDGLTGGIALPNERFEFTDTATKLDLLFNRLSNEVR